MLIPAARGGWYLHDGSERGRYVRPTGASHRLLACVDPEYHDLEQAVMGLKWAQTDSGVFKVGGRPWQPPPGWGMGRP